MGILDKLLDFIDLDEGEENKNEGDTTSRNSLEQKQNEDTPIKLSEVTDFIRELESYYTNDIFKERSEFINANLSVPSCCNTNKFSSTNAGCNM